MIALRTFKGTQIGIGGPRFDPGQHHAALTFRAAGALDGNERRLGMIMKIGHVMLLLSGGNVQHSLSPIKADGGAVMDRTYQPMSDCRHKNR